MTSGIGGLCNSPLAGQLLLPAKNPCAFAFSYGLIFVRQKMSLPITQALACPQCGKKTETLMWQSINVSLDKLLKKKLLNGELTTFVCKYCNHTCPIQHDLLYHDMKKEVMIHLKFPDSNGKIVMESKPLEATAKMLGVYRLRWVTSWDHLLEKIAIFDDDLDDRAIEMIKFGLWFKHASDDFSKINQLFFYRRRKSLFGKRELVFRFAAERQEEFFSGSEEAYASAMNVVSCFPKEKDWTLVNHEYLRAISPVLNETITAAKWEHKLLNCDFLLARNEIANLLKYSNNEARRRGGEYVWPKEIAEAVNLFLAKHILHHAFVLRCLNISINLQFHSLLIENRN